MDVSKSMNEQLQEFIQKDKMCVIHDTERDERENSYWFAKSTFRFEEDKFEKLTRNTNNGFEMLSKSFEQEITTLIREEIKHNARGTEKATVKIRTRPFLAIWTEDTVTLRRNDIIKFNHVVTNVGNGYSPMTGKFKAPKQGTYFFGGTVVSAPPNALRMMLMKSRTSIMIPYASVTQGDSYTFTAVLQLKAGDTVYIQKDNRVEKAYGRYHSTFSGFMI
ncbi:C1QL [Mytilus coruscus]|uniref:C1QL n=1 Tax=Mytilus coruscus TaxID=42192 RepID=A0A6J8AEB6_MYTCO|nr:C1QL [Mytilus coruscus]